MRSDSDSEWEDDPTLAARKRRMVARSSKGRIDDEGSAPPPPPHGSKRRKVHSYDEDEDDDEEHHHPGETSSASSAADLLSALPGVKRQSRYEPELPDEQLAQLSKEELSEWRKRARKVRNRESAAASRRKTRERINELESEVEGLKKKYQEALERIKSLTSQAMNAGAAAAAAAASSSPQVVSPPASVVSPDLTSVTRSPPVSPRHESWSLCGEQELFYHQDVGMDPTDHHHHLQHVIAISRPTAVKISGAEMADDPSSSFDNDSSCSSSKTDATEGGGSGSSDVSDVTDSDFDNDDRELSEFLWSAFASEENVEQCHHHPNAAHYGPNTSCDPVGYPLFDPDLELDALCV